MIYCIADVHLANRRDGGGELVGGLNTRAREILEAMRRASSMCDHEDHLVVLGDLFDHADPSPALLSAAQRALAPNAGAALAHVIVGNHDMRSSEIGNNACAPLWPVANVVEGHPQVIVDHTVSNVAALLVPFGTPVADTICDALMYAEEQADWVDAEERIILGHWGISTEDDPPFMRNARDAINVDELYNFCVKANVDGVAAGNWHKRRSFEVADADNRKPVHILQTGALVPTGYNNPGIEGYGTVCWWAAGVKQWKWIELPGRRYLRHVPRRSELQYDRGNKIFVKVDVDPDAGDIDEVRRILSEMPVASTVVPVNRQASKQASEAASAVQSQETLAEALAAFIDKMPIPTGVDRKEVLIAAQKYLRES